MVSITEGSFTNSRGQKLYTVQYLPDEQPKAALYFHHGLGEHIGRYKLGQLLPTPRLDDCSA